MSDKIRRQKDIISNATQSYLNATTVYQDWLDNASPMYITYYQISDEASRTDSGLEDTHEIIGSKTALRYYRIKNLPVRMASQFDIMVELRDIGLAGAISGDFVITPDCNINPKIGEIFAVESDSEPEIENHLFVITDVQYDRATSNKYYKCSYKLRPEYERDVIESNVVKRFIYDPNGAGNRDGVGDSILITEEDAVDRQNKSDLVDSLIDSYADLFYNPAMDTFTYQKALNASGTDFEYYWSPYINHFIYKNKIMEKTETDFLTEFYVEDYNESTFPNIYSEDGYRHSILYALEIKSIKNLETVYSSFVEKSVYDLNRPLNLPFFSSAQKYNLIDFHHKFNDKTFMLGAFNWLFDNEDKLFNTIKAPFTFTKNEEVYFNELDDIENDEDSKGIKLDKVYYKVNPQNSLDIVNMYSFFVNEDNEAELYSSDIKNLLDNAEPYLPKYFEINDNFKIFNIIKEYFTNSAFSVSAEILDAIKNTYFDNSFKSYFLMPMLIYVLQNS